MDKNEFDATVERLKGFQKGLSKGIVGERKRIVKLIKTAPDYNESYFCFHTLDKLVELIEEV